MGRVALRSRPPCPVVQNITASAQAVERPWSHRRLRKLCACAVGNRRWLATGLQAEACAGQVKDARAAADDLRRRLEETEAERDASRGDVERLEAVLEQVPLCCALLTLSRMLCGLFGRCLSARFFEL